ncbi:hypothetical protein [Nocardia testacea]|uniref:hypothetical protein n=1 Tax=Nocardia testacea TaxID=248551 RepID=UPI0033C422DD
MAIADSEITTQRNDSHAFEVLGRVISLLFDPPGPLAESLAFHMWPLLDGSGFVLTWRGVVPTEIQVIQYLVNASADDEMTTVLRPGDVWFDFAAGDGYTHIGVPGVQFQLRPMPMFRSEVYDAWGKYWRKGELRTLLNETMSV